VDRIRREDGQLIIGEVKKSSAFLESARYQLLYYLRTLKEMGIRAQGELLFPEEKKRETVILTDQTEKELDAAIADIRRIARMPVAPKPVKIGFCRRCAYREYCWAEEGE
jgi:CRISPR-associated exonuclease Cas4